MDEETQSTNRSMIKKSRKFDTITHLYQIQAGKIHQIEFAREFFIMDKPIFFIH